jgi:hypothetical protein
VTAQNGALRKPFLGPDTLQSWKNKKTHSEGPMFILKIKRSPVKTDDKAVEVSSPADR